MDCVFDIDGTVARADQRLAHITNPELPKNWDMFFNSGEILKDEPIEPIWEILTGLVRTGNRIIFITGRPERTRAPTYEWLTNIDCPIRCVAASHWMNNPNKGPILYMRGDGDRRHSHEVKRDLLVKCRNDYFNPIMAFEDRAADAKNVARTGAIMRTSK